MTSSKIYVSVIIPVYNEKDNLELLSQRLITTLNSIEKPYEIIFVNDGSKDNSIMILEKIYSENPDMIRVIDFKRNFGQHMAIMAGFEHAQGEIVVTLDADLQNPPEEIPKLLEFIEKGHDLVNGYRVRRQDSFFRRYASIIINFIRSKTTKIHLKDEGCMLRAYSRDIADLIAATKSKSIFIPALAYSYASNSIDVPVSHEARFAGRSQYKLFDLVRLYFDLMTGYSLVPLQIFTCIGVLVSILSVLFVIYLFIRRIFVGPEVQGVFTLFAIMFLLVGILLMGLGITGEYIGRIYQEVRAIPRFAIKKILGKKSVN